MREWLVAGGIIQSPEGLLLVQNRRRNGSLDWSTPGGVIDAGETVLEGLGREINEETGLVVDAWRHLAYQIDVDFVDSEMHLRVEAHVAESWQGSLTLDDPDGIVVDAGFKAHAEVQNHLADSPRWVSEPLTTWLADPSERGFAYRVTGEKPGFWTVERRH